MKTRYTASEDDYFAKRKQLLGRVESLDEIADHFPLFIRRQVLVRYFTRYSLFQKILDVKGSIVECGVHKGSSLMLYAQLSAIYEPYALNREIIGFDTFEGFPEINREKDGDNPEVGELADTDLELLKGCIDLYDQNRPIGHLPKVRLVQGDATQTIPQFFKDNSYSVVALLYMDFDLYAPTKVALETILPRMPKGAVIAFDEVNDKLWPGETSAMLEIMNMRNLQLQKCPADPFISYAVL
ncbi:MAG: class I SAM-dependent methyltransferase [bacterium]